MVNITATGQGQRLSILEKTPPGFVVVNEEGGPVSFDWVAMAKVQEATTDPQEAEQQVAPEIRERMHLSPEKKQEVMQHFGNIKITREPQRIGE